MKRGVFEKEEEKVKALTTSFSAASQIFSTLASDKPLIDVKLCERFEKIWGKRRGIEWIED